jgi:Flp pilus assembly pilin Flp
MTRKAIGVGKALLLDENGQAMLDYIVIIVFSTIVTITFVRLVKYIVHRTTDAVSASLDSD